MDADLDTFSTALYVRVDDLLKLPGADATASVGRGTSLFSDDVWAADSSRLNLR